MARNYKKVSCHTTKTAAKKKAQGMRKNGKTAQVRKQGKSYCVFSAGKSKVKKKRKTAKKRTTRRRRA